MAGVELFDYKVVLPIAIAFSSGKPQDLVWFALGLDSVKNLLDKGCEVNGVTHQFRLLYFVAGKIIFLMVCMIVSYMIRGLGRVKLNKYHVTNDIINKFCLTIHLYPKLVLFLSN